MSLWFWPLLLGCGPSAESLAAERLPRALSADYPMRVIGPGQDFTLGSPPTRILPSNAAWIDFVSLLVGPERIVALPAEAFGYSRLTEQPGAWAAIQPFPVFEGERALALAPDLVLAHSWQNPETVTTLRDAGVAVLVIPVPESWSEILRTLELLGDVLAVPERARELVGDLESRRERLARRTAPLRGLEALCYTNLGAGGWTGGAHTTGDVLLELAGLGNAATRAGLVGDVPADLERILFLAPDIFVVGRPDDSENSPPSATFLQNEPALSQLEALREGRILSLPPSLFTSASPELMRGAETLADELESLGCLAPRD